MPEGDTIWRTAAALRRRLTGHTVQRARPANTLGRLGGRLITGVDPVGKHLFIRFDNGLSLHTHMRMTGAWHVYAPGERWHRPEHIARAVLETDDTVAVCFLAPTVELVRDDSNSVGHLGPDGIGNIHRCNALWDLGLDPWQPVAATDDDTLRHLAGTARDRVRRSAVATGFRGAPGVHGCGGRPCPRCGTPIAVRTQGEMARLTFWCRRCQVPR